MPPQTFYQGQSPNDSSVGLPYSNDITESSSMKSSSSAAGPSGETESPWPKTWRAYACWLGCFFLMFNSWGLVNAYSTFSSYYVGHSLMAVDQLELNLIGSTQSFLVLLLSAPMGRLLDAGHYRYVLGTGAFLVPFGMFMLSVAHPNREDATGVFSHIWATQGLVVGLGMSCFFVASSQIAATWFPRNRALAVGVVACGASIAGVVYPTMLRYLIDSLGFNNAVRAVSGLVTLTAIYSWIFATPNPSHHHPRPKSYRAVHIWIDPDAFRNKAFCWFTAAIAFLFFGFYPVFFNLEEWAAVSGFGTRGGTKIPIRVANTSDKPIETFWLLTIMNGASTVGRLFLSAFGDKLGALNMHYMTTIVCSILIYTLWTLSNTLSEAVAFCVFFGVFSGAVIGLPPASISNILECTYVSKDNAHIAKQKLGLWTGMMYTVAAIPSLTGPIIAGHLVSEYRTYITVQMWSGTNLLLSAICMLLARWYLPLRDGQHAMSFFHAKYRGDMNVQLVTVPLSQATTMGVSEAVSRVASDEKANATIYPPRPAALKLDSRV
ncbi:MFS general substrate transporter [Byssothecium circinans]|uniref:MFS general substrate transporter n=1 Tax=Byssothecium circinans TaxID=147558 RepID=A0A6A5TC00_9PLEO|nr:MFS general substrate transporter [Byssothecium circinans]